MDERHLRQVLLNLLSSTIKYTPKNSFITLLVKMEYSDVRFDVEDTSHGLTEEKIEEVFISFSQIREIVAQTLADGARPWISNYA